MGFLGQNIQKFIFSCMHATLPAKLILVRLVLPRFMSLCLHCVSQLRLPTGLMFISQMIYKYGELRWNDIDRKTEEFGENLSHCHFVHHKSQTGRCSGPPL
jgi:hypothetical protein